MMLLLHARLRAVGDSSVMMKSGRRTCFRVWSERRLTAKSYGLILVVVETFLRHRRAAGAHVHVDGAIADGNILRSMTTIDERSAISGIQM